MKQKKLQAIKVCNDPAAGVKKKEVVACLLGFCTLTRCRKKIWQEFRVDSDSSVFPPNFPSA
jgi:hypothetical protein